MNEQPIDAKDLCVGSYVQLENVLGKERIICTVIAIRDSSVALDMNEISLLGRIGKANCSDLHPIPITAEWLEKLGFTLSTRHEHYHNLGWSVYIRDGIEVQIRPGDIFLCGFKHIYGIHILYVHHLQALIWQIERVWLTIEREEVTT